MGIKYYHAICMVLSGEERAASIAWHCGLCVKLILEAEGYQAILAGLSSPLKSMQLVAR